ncbi:MAG TPA: hypothetical protein VH061_13110 [Solirubrobacteraceae bacterium]|nr:hypothetical protein [Solirubrobacteraceae bacterium]
MDTWTFLWLMVFLKIPIIGLFLIVRWAVKDAPEAAAGGDGGIGPRPRPVHPHHPRSRPPRKPRRGPHRDPTPGSPPRIRAVATLGHGPRV